MDFTIKNNIASLTPTVCRLMKIDRPVISSVEAISEVIKIAETMNAIDKADKCLVFCPDAIGLHITKDNPKLFENVFDQMDAVVALNSVFPPKTPVCYASIFTGALPEVHGIREYKKSIVENETIFHALLRAGKRVAITAVEKSSIDLIFRGTAVDCYTEDSDDDVTARCIELLQRDEHDFIVAYQQEYDDTLHRLNHYCDEALSAIENHLRAFSDISAAWNKYWKDYNRLLIFAPDHGAHFDEDLGHSNHCDDIPEDMQVLHYYKIESKG